MGVQCNGGGSDVPFGIIGKTAKPNTSYKLTVEYNQNTQISKLIVEGELNEATGTYHR